MVSISISHLCLCKTASVHLFRIASNEFSLVVSERFCFDTSRPISMKHICSTIYSSYTYYLHLKSENYVDGEMDECVPFCFSYSPLFPYINILYCFSFSQYRFKCFLKLCRCLDFYSSSFVTEILSLMKVPVREKVGLNNKTYERKKKNPSCSFDICFITSHFRFKRFHAIFSNFTLVYSLHCR